LKFFFERRIFIFETNKKSSDLGAPPADDPAEKTAFIFVFAALLLLSFFLRSILLTLMYDCYMGIAKSPLRGVSRCFPV